MLCSGWNPRRMRRAPSTGLKFGVYVRFFVPLIYGKMCQLIIELYFFHFWRSHSPTLFFSNAEKACMCGPLGTSRHCRTSAPSRPLTSPPCPAQMKLLTIIWMLCTHTFISSKDQRCHYICVCVCVVCACVIIKNSYSATTYISLAFTYSLL